MQVWLLSLSLLLLLLPVARTYTIQVGANKEIIQKYLTKHIVEQAQEEISKKGSFFIAVPGGSVLKLLSGLKDFTATTDFSKFHLFYVNHKCVPENDPSSTHFKAKGLFLDDIPSMKVYPITPEDDVKTAGYSTISHNYQKIILEQLPKVNNVPVFDYMLLGMGADGHIGSLYGNRKEPVCCDPYAYILPVDKKVPSSITMSLSLMNAAKFRQVVLMGKDKADAAKTAVLQEKPVGLFPVVGLSTRNTNFILDSDAATVIQGKVTTTAL